MRMPKQSPPRRRGATGAQLNSRSQGSPAQGLLPNSLCSILCDAGKVACIAAGVPAPVCEAAAALCRSAC